jgi:hypothetical protein
VPHIQLPPELPGITGAFAFGPDTAKPMRELAGERMAYQGDVSQPVPATAG